MVDKLEASCSFIFQGNMKYDVAINFPVEVFHIMELQFLPLLGGEGLRGRKEISKNKETNTGYRVISCYFCSASASMQCKTNLLFLYATFFMKYSSSYFDIIIIWQ